MEDSIVVKTSPENFVKLYAWPNAGGLLLNGPLSGNANENGIFEKTFFSLNVPEIKYQVIILRNGEKIIDEKFPNQGIENPLLIDCSDNIDCSISILNESYEEEPIVVEPIENETAINETAGYIQTAPTGNAIFTNEDGSLNILSVVIGILIIIIILVLLIMFLKRKKKANPAEAITTRKVTVPGNDDDDELAAIQRKVKEKAGEIQGIKSTTEKAQELEAAKRKLTQEERELEALKNPRPAEAQNSENQQPQSPQSPQ